ncbi:MAG: DNA polymerase/3'-5' exonuclease PolX [Chloroflexi bacterium]|nr:DNA polymerase/3'-5' exonuclease PolX [Chloroflexota bacterium]
MPLWQRQEVQAVPRDGGIGDRGLGRTEEDLEMSRNLSNEDETCEKLATMNNAQIAKVFENIANLLELQGDSAFKIRAYQRAARTIEHLPVELSQLLNEEKDLRRIPGIGEAIESKIQELVATGRLEYLEKLIGEFPEGILALMDVPGVGPKTAMRISKEMGISTVEALEQAIVEGRLATLPRLGEKTAGNILRHIRSLRTKDQRIPLGRALPIAEQVIGALRQTCSGIQHIDAAGSLRRWQETIGDIDIMGSAEDPEEVINCFVELPLVEEVLVHGPTKASVVVHGGLQVDLRMVEGSSYGALIQYFTGSKQHNILLREFANRMGLSLNEYGIAHVKTEQVERFADERSFYARLGLQFIPPELREGLREVEMAARQALPTLVELKDVRGDLHCHTNESDGHDSLESMVEAARLRGYEYVAITDHSVGRGIASGLSEERLIQQLARIRSLDRSLLDIKVLAGSEVDIRSDGSLDYPDELLSQLDVVVASVHSAMGQERGKMTDRIVRAMHNPHVDVVGHLTCRLMGEREPVDLDVEAIFKAAVETSTALEVNASPERLDLKDIHVLRARELGVPLVISTDAHATEHLDNMRFGVATARRGWCQAGDILNTRPLGEFLPLLHRKSESF